MSGLAASVAVATRGRPVRLRWLLNALSEQRFPEPELEVVIAHDPGCAETERVLRTHPLGRSGRLKAVPFPPGRQFPGAGRNAAWRAAGAPLILFTDDDCRPAAEWVSRAVSAARARPGAIIQGRTIPDPDEAATLLGAPWTRTMAVTPPTVWAPTCNIAYPREVLEAVDGFNERLRVGEDTDLAQRAQEAGAQLVAAPELLVYHAVEAHWLGGMLLAQMRWSDLAYVARSHREVRQALWGGIWWKPEHAALTAALLGALLARRHPLAPALALPWLRLSMRARGYSPRGLLRSASELPGRAAIDAIEILAMARGSVRHRTLML